MADRLLFRELCSSLLSRWLVVLSGCVLFGPAKVLHAQDISAPQQVSFNRDIRGVLSDKCFLCHGPDESTREAGLRLDRREDALDAGAIVPGEVDASELIARITSDDPDLVMPPPGTGKTISDDERTAIEQWIQQGAAYEEHWAYVAPRFPDVPEVKNDPWCRNDIDRFVLARLEANGDSPNKVADPATLTRRLHLDLTGLPPTLSALDAVEHAENPAHVLDQQVDSLMRSVAFGERWGRWWLDAARYADSAGYEKDMQRNVWFYRDWVIDAMNRDLPYNQFVIEQIAGDLLPGATQSQRVATGFLRNSMTNEEGGADPEQFRVEGMFDRMDAIGKSILGITTQCAQCHTHKYDPISHHEYYSMFAALNDFHEACITVFTPEQAALRDQVLDEIQSAKEGFQRQNPEWRSEVHTWAMSFEGNDVNWQTLHPKTVPFEGQKFNVLDDGSVVSESYAPTKASNDFSLSMRVGTITAVRLDAMMHPQLPRGGPGRSIDGTGALSEFKLRVQPTSKDADGKPKPAVEVKFHRAISDANASESLLKPQYRNREPEKDKRVVGPPEYAIDGDESTAWTTDLGPGRSNQARHIIFLPAEPVVIEDDAAITFTLVQKHGGWNSDDNQNFLIGRYKVSITDSATLPKETVPTSAEPILAMDPANWTAEQSQIAFDAWRQSFVKANPDSTRAKDLSALNQRIESAWQRFPETTTQLVAQSINHPRETFVFARGDFLSPTDRVEADAPKFLHAMPKNDTPDRLRFAKWLVSEDSPTTARVIVNRIWQAYFGRGLVSTPEDFGFQSAAPSHPQLLDYLAMELMQNNWSLKHIHRLIVDSATYRQSSVVSQSDWLDDPDNERLARGPRHRMEAEMVRDTALFVSGLLNTSVGGPSVYPPAPEFLFQPPTSYGPKIWDTSTGSDQYRRSLYVHQYRSIPYPPLQVFDAPKGDAACVRRERSNTPLQSLVLLNEPQFVDAARALAARILREADADDEARVQFAFRLCTGRIPDKAESLVLIDLLRKQRQHIGEGNMDLTQLLGVPQEACLQLTGHSAEELAAWMTVARTLLNLDETITKS
ncbi:PSD1 and planctomycete cytochrome C domain-containing protein [Rhodopirellula sp. JC740]|uniref:PSD1 and planctomycete cytochrome C domain-containing protein n=1 Tax=Rhodopirellula halodulae TaxID=2894198 RepID=A0ABS8NGL2_9BACT|nr:PSD1 and planctomycete cytochrome C domain-containing protein [Rhodopirellula sp. JC740]MCC9642549.1 PSD1 and planctomycete cytochrome C domain-containing protein [Rhodopirellula sp. JC740]